MDHPCLFPCTLLLLLGACAAPAATPPDAARPPVNPPSVAVAPPSMPAVPVAAIPKDPPTAPERGCESPADCPDRGDCVVSGLGPHGCGAGLCCGNDECYDGCLKNEDCHSCRPICVKEPGRSGVCRLKRGL